MEAEIGFVLAFARPGAGVSPVLAGVEMYALIAALLLVLWNVRFPGLWPISMDRSILRIAMLRRLFSCAMISVWMLNDNPNFPAMLGRME